MSHSYMYPTKPPQPESKSGEAKSMVFLDNDGSLVDGNLHDTLNSGIDAFNAFINLELEKYKTTDQYVKKSKEWISDANFKKAFQQFPESKVEESKVNAADKQEAVKKRWEFVVDVLEGKDPPKHNDDAVVNDIKEYLKKFPIMMVHTDPRLKGKEKAIEKAKEFHCQYIVKIVKGEITSVPPSYPDERLEPFTDKDKTASLAEKRAKIKGIIKDATDNHVPYVVSRTDFPHAIRPYIIEIIDLDKTSADKIRIIGIYDLDKDDMILMAMLSENFRKFLDRVNAAIVAKAKEAKIDDNEIENWKKKNGLDLQQWIKNPSLEHDSIKNVKSFIKDLIEKNDAFKDIKEHIANFTVFYDDSATQIGNVKWLGCKTVQADVKYQGKSLSSLETEINTMTQKRKAEDVENVSRIEPP